MPMFSDSIRSLAAALICAAIAIAALVLARDVLVPLALGALLAFVLAPLVRILSEHRVPRAFAVAIVLAGTVAAVSAGAYLFSSQLLSLAGGLSSYKDNLSAKVRTITGSDAPDGALKRAVNSIEVLGAVVRDQSGPRPGGMAAPPVGSQPTVVVAKETDTAVYIDQLQSLAHRLATVGLTLLFTMFLLAQQHDIRDRVVRLAGTDNMTDTTSALSEAGERLSQVFLRQAAINAGFGCVVVAGLALIGVPNPLLWGIATTFLRFIPFIGSFLSAIPPILLAAAVDPGWGPVAATIALFAVGEPLVGHIVEPLVLGKGAGLSPFAMVAAASFWALVWGPLGLLLAAPLTMALVVLGQYIPRLEFLSILLGDQPALVPSQEFYHRLLSEDPSVAAEQLEEAAAEASLAAAVDRIALPALRHAARDYQIERLDKEQAASIRQTASAIIELVAGSAPARDSQSGKSGQSPSVLIIPARGPIDTVAAEFVSAVINTVPGQSAVATTQASGMMALAAARAEGADPATIVISTAGGMNRQHLELIERRARRDFPGARLIACDWASDPCPKLSPLAQKAVAPCTSSLPALLELLSLRNNQAPVPAPGGQASLGMLSAARSA